MRFLLLLFVVIPVIELWLLIQVGSLIGALPTIALVLLTAVVGVSLLRRQGLSTLMRGNRKLESGELPAQEMIEGVILAFSGALLLAPGFFTDAIGLLGLLPPVRRHLARKLVAAGPLHAFGYQGAAFRREAPMRQDRVIEGEFWREDRRDPRP